MVCEFVCQCQLVHAPGFTFTYITQFPVDALPLTLTPYVPRASGSSIHCADCGVQYANLVCASVPFVCAATAKTSAAITRTAKSVELRVFMGYLIARWTWSGPASPSLCPRLK